MARPKKPSLEQQVADLTKLVSTLVAHISKQPEPEVEVTPRPIVSKQKKKAIPKVGKAKRVKEDEESDMSVRAGASKKLKERGKSKTQSVAKPIHIGKRPNLFETMVERSQFKDDTKIDKKLWKGKHITPRATRTTLVAVDCSDCGNEFEVNPNILKKDEDGEIAYTCDDCIRERV